MVFEKELKKGCAICGPVHMEEHAGQGGGERMEQLTWTGRILPAVVLAALFLVIFVYTMTYTGVELPSGLYT